LHDAHADVGAGMAINDALTLLFLGLSALERCMRLEKSPQRRMLYLKIVNRVALTTGRGQHADLLDRLVSTAVTEAFRRSGSNQIKTAEALGVTRNVVRTYLKNLALI
jgi:hypothetical protein